MAVGTVHVRQPGAAPPGSGRRHVTFISNAFVPSENLPTPLRIFAELNPVSALVLAARTLFGNVPPGAPTANSWTLQHPILAVLIGMAVLLAIFVPLAIRRFGRITSR